MIWGPVSHRKLSPYGDRVNEWLHFNESQSFVFIGLLNYLY